METVGQLGEHEVIERLTALLGRHPDLVAGAGDDCAVARLPGGAYDQVFTTDPVVEGIHFSAAEDPVRVGNKAAGRVLSDIAAMGACPHWLLVNVAAPTSLEMSRLEAVYEGMNACCSRFGATIIGGDLAEGPCLEIHVFGTGMLPAGSALLRSGASVGDAIFVTGPLGGSIRGKHLDFIPKVEEGLFLRESGSVCAMMDISDGLATDLRHMMERSGVGAELYADQIPCTGTLDQALYDGEDYELLFTVPEDHVAALETDWAQRFGTGLCHIGRITEKTSTLTLRTEDGSFECLKRKAFEHFSAEKGTS